MLLMDQGHTCELIFTVQRNDVECFSAAAEIDPVYAKLLKQAEKKGLIISPLVCDISRTGVILTNQLLPLK